MKLGGTECISHNLNVHAYFFYSFFLGFKVQNIAFRKLFQSELICSHSPKFYCLSESTPSYLNSMYPHAHIQSSTNHIYKEYAYPSK